MKKAVSLILVLVLCLGLCACSVNLTESQSAACKQADELVAGLADLADNNGTKSKTKEIDGKIVYIATIDYATTIDDSNAKTFQSHVLPALEKTLHPENIYVVLYLSENGSEVYRLIDSQLDPSVLD